MITRVQIDKRTTKNAWRIIIKIDGVSRWKYLNSKNYGVDYDERRYDLKWKYGRIID